MMVVLMLTSSVCLACSLDRLILWSTGINSVPFVQIIYNVHHHIITGRPYQYFACTLIDSNISECIAAETVKNIVVEGTHTVIQKIIGD